LSEEDGSRRRRRLLTVILAVAIVLVVNLACVFAVISLVESGTETPQIYVSSFDYYNYGNTSSAYVSLTGTVMNPSSLEAKNVNVTLYIYYYKYGNVLVNSTTLSLDSIPGGESKSFDANLSYSGSYYYDFVNGYYYGDHSLIMNSRFDFGLSFFVVTVPIAFLLPVLDIYSAYRLGSFAWIRARKKESLLALGWTVAIVIVIMVEYISFYSSLPGSFMSYFATYPTLQIWDWLLIFFISLVAGVFMADLEVAIYSFAVTLFLSLVFEGLIGSLFVWFGLGISNSFSTTSPGLAFTTYLQTVLQQVFLGILSMVNIEIPCFLLLGVGIGAILRAFLDPTV
jgi:hypothetical protein